ncbi:MAG: VTT domain-containing protein [Rickettsiales bacterium]|jgi:membrane protein YqaA with SNARE-associated domain|nr:VTT domain-containing protein [Rickettsiales bacterium]
MKLQTYLFRKAENTRAMFWVVLFLTMCESVFLFIPTEVFMTPPIVANKKSALPITIAAAIGSLVGGAIAYCIGAFLFNSAGLWIIETFSSPAQFEVARQMFADYGVWIIFITAFTPVPYKLMSICAGFLGYNALLYLGVSAIFRTGRFAIAGYLLWRFQEQANKIAKKYFWPLTLAAIAAAVVGAIIIV